jgi:hypothetical protein
MIVTSSINTRQFQYLDPLPCHWVFLLTNYVLRRYKFQREWPKNFMLSCLVFPNGPPLEFKEAVRFFNEFTERFFQRRAPINITV